MSQLQKVANIDKKTKRILRLFMFAKVEDFAKHGLSFLTTILEITKQRLHYMHFRAFYFSYISHYNHPHYLNYKKTPPRFEMKSQNKELSTQNMEIAEKRRTHRGTPLYKSVF